MSKSIITLIPLLMMSCSSNKAIETEGNTLSSNLYQVVYQSEYAGSEERSFKVINNQNELNALYALLQQEQVPVVDFRTANIVVLNMGTKNTGGFTISPEKIVEETDKLTLFVKETSPKKEDMVTMVITNPVCVVKINSKKNISFQ